VESFSSQAERAVRALEIVHSDVCGPFRTESLGKGRYFVTFIDDFSRYVTMYVLRRKGEVFEKFKQYKALVENKSSGSGYKISVLRTDNGREYLSMSECLLSIWKCN
jgi:hypothetical protein